MNHKENEYVKNNTETLNIQKTIRNSFHDDEV